MGRRLRGGKCRAPRRSRSPAGRAGRIRASARRRDARACARCSRPTSRPRRGVVQGRDHLRHDGRFRVVVDDGTVEVGAQELNHGRRTIGACVAKATDNHSLHEKRLRTRHGTAEKQSPTAKLTDAQKAQITELESLNRQKRRRRNCFSKARSRKRRRKVTTKRWPNSRSSSRTR